MKYALMTLALCAAIGCSKEETPPAPPTPAAAAAAAADAKEVDGLAKEIEAELADEG